MMTKELYQSPEIEAVLFDSEDIITTSILATPTAENETKPTKWWD